MEKLQILVVDDLVLNRILLTEILEEIGYPFDIARNGKEALDILKNKNYDLIFMDIEMPVMNGFETTRHIRKKFPAPKNKIPIIAITAHDPETFFEDFEGVGFDELISKPYTVDKIMGVINNLE